jgi:hypothetical protein
VEATPGKLLREGREVVGPILERHGFTWRDGLSGRSSAGQFASGEYVRGERRLELHFLCSLGMVTYYIGTMSLSHDQFMRHIGHRAEARYPGFSKAPLDAFHDLAHDLGSFCEDFLSGSGDVFRAAHAASQSYEKQSGFAKLEKQ